MTHTEEKRAARALVLAAAFVFADPCFGAEPAAERTAEARILEGMMHTYRCVTPALAGYSSLRRYHLENKRFGKTATMTVRFRFRYPGEKKFEVLSEEGSAVIRKRVLRKLLESEVEAAGDTMREATQITPRNYSFRLLGAGEIEGRKAYLLEAAPREGNRFLFRGKVWVDAEDYAVARIEATPAKSPSFWIRKTSFVHEYRKFGGFWLPVSNRSESEAVAFGRTELTIEYSGYKLEAPGAGPCP
jgi:outer membrane lipoprotein-sorting protein